MWAPNLVKYQSLVSRGVHIYGGTRIILLSVIPFPKMRCPPRNHQKPECWIVLDLFIVEVYMEHLILIGYYPDV